MNNPLKQASITLLNKHNQNMKTSSAIHPLDALNQRLPTPATPTTSSTTNDPTLPANELSSTNCPNNKLSILTEGRVLDIVRQVVAGTRTIEGARAVLGGSNLRVAINHIDIAIPMDSWLSVLVTGLLKIRHMRDWLLLQANERVEVGAIQSESESLPSEENTLILNQDRGVGPVNSQVCPAVKNLINPYAGHMLDNEPVTPYIPFQYLTQDLNTCATCISPDTCGYHGVCVDSAARMTQEPIALPVPKTKLPWVTVQVMKESLLWSSRHYTSYEQAQLEQQLPNHVMYVITDVAFERFREKIALERKTQRLIVNPVNLKCYGVGATFQAVRFPHSVYTVAAINEGRVFYTGPLLAEPGYGYPLNDFEGKLQDGVWAMTSAPTGVSVAVFNEALPK